MRHALRNALIPILTILGPLVADLFTGSSSSRRCFACRAWGGIHDEHLESGLPHDHGDHPLFAALLSIVNLIIDLLYAVVDPRVRLAR